MPSPLLTALFAPADVLFEFDADNAYSAANALLTPANVGAGVGRLADLSGHNRDATPANPANPPTVAISPWGNRLEIANHDGMTVTAPIVDAAITGGWTIFGFQGERGGQFDFVWQNNGVRFTGGGGAQPAGNDTPTNNQAEARAFQQINAYDFNGGGSGANQAKRNSFELRGPLYALRVTRRGANKCDIELICASGQVRGIYGLTDLADAQLKTGAEWRWQQGSNEWGAVVARSVSDDEIAAVFAARANYNTTLAGGATGIKTLAVQPTTVVGRPHITQGCNSIARAETGIGKNPSFSVAQGVKNWATAASLYHLWDLAERYWTTNNLGIDGAGPAGAGSDEMAKIVASFRPQASINVYWFRELINIFNGMPAAGDPTHDSELAARVALYCQHGAAVKAGYAARAGMAGVPLKVYAETGTRNNFTFTDGQQANALLKSYCTAYPAGGAYCYVPNAGTPAAGAFDYLFDTQAWMESERIRLGLSVGDMYSDGHMGSASYAILAQGQYNMMVALDPANFTAVENTTLDPALAAPVVSVSLVAGRIRVTRNNAAGTTGYRLKRLVAGVPSTISQSGMGLTYDDADYTGSLTDLAYSVTALSAVGVSPTALVQSAAGGGGSGTGRTLTFTLSL